MNDNTLLNQSELRNNSQLQICPSCGVQKEKKEFTTKGGAVRKRCLVCLGKLEELKSEAFRKGRCYKGCRSCFKVKYEEFFSPEVQDTDRTTGHCLECLRKKNREKRSRLIPAHWSCPGCGRERSEVRPAIDHCHKTGDRRGIICGACNSCLGFAYDKPCTLRNLANYLENQRSIFD